MKKIFLASGLIILVFTLSACTNIVNNENNNNVLENNNETSDKMSWEDANINNGDYIVDAGLSEINWKGERIIGSSHAGKLRIKSGEFSIDDEKINSGTIVFDMQSIADNENNQRLITHLKSDDFFSVETYPEATLTIKESSLKTAEENRAVFDVVADLEIKGIVNEINFEAILEPKNNFLSVYTKTEIDRTRWNVRYGSGKFFDNLGDNTIKDAIELEVNLISSLQ
ncbi:MAG: YceI family protein [Candidatus Pacebacteria bacterium]|nr:YceI family protein [Candidatus Paceibacterota bacterium]